MSDTVINLASAFSPAPAGRNYDDGPFPGEKFREELLIPALRSFDRVTVELDGTSGMGSSFLEEAFGGLVRAGFTPEELRQRLHVESSRPSYKERIWIYIQGAQVEAHH
jgi:hypothetical protein